MSGCGIEFHTKGNLLERSIVPDLERQRGVRYDIALSSRPTVSDPEVVFHVRETSLYESIETATYERRTRKPDAAWLLTAWVLIAAGIVGPAKPEGEDASEEQIDEDAYRRFCYGAGGVAMLLAHTAMARTSLNGTMEKRDRSGGAVLPSGKSRPAKGIVALVTANGERSSRGSTVVRTDSEGMLRVDLLDDVVLGERYDPGSFVEVQVVLEDKTRHEERIPAGDFLEPYVEVIGRDIALYSREPRMGGVAAARGRLGDLHPLISVTETAFRVQSSRSQLWIRQQDAKLFYAAADQLAEKHPPVIAVQGQVVEAGAGPVDGVLQPHEDIRLRIVVRNSGPTRARAARATMTATPPGIVVSPAVLELGDISPGGEVDGECRLTVPEGLTQSCAQITVSVEDSEGNQAAPGIFAAEIGSVTRPQLVIRGTSLEEDTRRGKSDGDGVIEAGETAELTIILVNSGAGPAYGVEMRVRSSAAVRVESVVSSWGVLEPGEMCVAMLSLTTPSGSSRENIELVVEATDSRGFGGTLLLLPLSISTAAASPPDDPPVRNEVWDRPLASDEYQ
jgi:hypothetical protein